MANMRRFDSKAALAQQRAELRRSARGKAHIGDDTGSAAGRAAERERVHRLQEMQRRAFRRQEPITAIVADLVIDSFKLARTLITLPFRLAAALRGGREVHAS